MRVFIGADHGGFELKQVTKSWLMSEGYEVTDCGADHYDPLDDYPDFAFPVADGVSADTEDHARGILFCRSSGGVVIAANKVKGIRAVSVMDVLSAQHARQHNNANVIGISGDWVEKNQVEKIITAFLETPFLHDERHERRLEKIAEREK